MLNAIYFCSKKNKITIFEYQTKQITIMAIFKRNSDDPEDLRGYRADALDEMASENETHVFCEWCGKEIPDADIYANAFGNVLCEDCAGKRPCDGCGEIHAPEDLKEIEGELFCEKCYNEISLYWVNCSY